jgi:nitrogenase molybdenum-iron protein alpha/beta subunit
VRDIGYAGYVGMVELARHLVAAIDSPMWRQVRLAAPWHAPVSNRYALAA